MIPLPPFLKRFQRQAKDCLTHDLVKDLQFSGGTYQIMVLDPNTKEEEWVFLQFNKQNVFKDSLCSCAESENKRGCVHQAAAYLYIYGNSSLPLHLRFERSLWNQLFRQLADEYPSVSPDTIKTSKGQYAFKSGRKVVFSITPGTPAAKDNLENILYHRELQNEENSIKFSNLTDEEIELWKKGRPPLSLSYELSFWSDLAKWFFSLQERAQDYEISFKESPQKGPEALSVQFSDLEAEWRLSNEILPNIIPALSTVKSPLIVHSAFKGEIDKIVFDKKNHAFAVVAAKSSENDSTSLQGKTIGEWNYVPGDGFYPRNSRFPITQEELRDVEKVLNEHHETLKGLVKDCVIRETPVPISYSLKFDKEWNLHIEAYIFVPGDLSAKGSHSFNSWVYLNDDGFYRVEGQHFDRIHTIIPADGIADFVNQNRMWLNSQGEFSTHITPIEADLTYSLRADGALTFTRNLAVKESVLESKDFGRWVYVPGQGFFSKLSMQTNLPLQAGHVIPPGQISVFIRRNQAELKLVQGFFSDNSPVTKASLDVRLTGPDQVTIVPQYELLPEYQDKKVLFFDDYVYVEGEGFHELPAAMRLPEHFTHPVVLEGKNLTDFVSKQLVKVLPYAGFIDPKLIKPSTKHLVAKEITYADQKSELDYNLNLSYQTDLGTLSISSLWWALKQGQSYLYSEAGLIDLSDKQYSWLKKIDKDKVDRTNNRIVLSSLELLRLNALEDIDVSTDNLTTQQQSRKLLHDLVELKVPTQPDLTGLTSTLRPYQHLGVDWLWFLYHHGLSGLLCDDMGLGKTHQAMGLLTACTNYCKAQNHNKCHYLIVCPTSIIYHWQEKLSQFLPQARVWTYYGAKRSLERFYEDSDILLTSYGVWRNEVEKLSAMRFEVAIFDELQIAKNQTSRIYSALQKANARMRLGMTGTPIENRLRELKSLFDIVLPSYMPSENDYREFFVRPIEKEGDRDRKLLLSRLVKPFVLRRKKEDVLFDLPEKTEEISHCDLLPDQRNLYVQVLSSSKDRLIDELKDEQSPVPYMHIFALLSQLKQICNHPAAYLKKPDEYQKYQSGKWDLFLELLEEARESGQKVVVFSQYLAMLDIIENYLTQHHIGYATIRGSTTNRGEQLRNFNTNPKCEVFVGSLQAAGLGVDLTAGSVVIHYDRWWNPARENQATDRVHRIGQTRGVQVFKLMTKGTLEEHIDFMIARKGRLLEDVVSVDSHQIMKKFDRHEMISLLQAIP